MPTRSAPAPVYRTDAADPGAPAEVYREDRFTLDAASGFDQKTGFYRGQGTIARVGVFGYRMADGSMLYEHVPPESLQDAAWIESCKLAPVTLGHPADMVKKDNAAQVIIGQLGDGVTFQAGRNTAPLSVTRKDGLDRLQAGTRELSCGYTCTLVAKSGEFQGQRYDAVQTNRRCNHVALVDRGRHGSEVRVRMDGAEQVDDADPKNDPAPAPQQRTKMLIKIGRVQVEVADASVAQAIVTHLDSQEAALAKAELEAKDLKVKADKFEAERDQAKADAEKVKADAAEQLKDADVKARARVALEAKATEVLGKDVKLDATDDEIRAQVVAKLAPAADLKDKSSAYIEARFDAALEGFKQDAPVDQARKNMSTKNDSSDPRTPTQDRQVAALISHARALGIDPSKLQ